MLLSRTAGRTPLAGAQHIAARERAAAIAPYVQPGPVLKDLGLALAPGAAAPSKDTWRRALVAAVGARSREQVAREIASALQLTAAAAAAEAADDAGQNPPPSGALEP